MPTRLKTSVLLLYIRNMPTGFKTFELLLYFRNMPAGLKTSVLPFYFRNMLTGLKTSGLLLSFRTIPTRLLCCFSIAGTFQLDLRPFGNYIRKSEFYTKTLSLISYTVLQALFGAIKWQIRKLFFVPHKHDGSSWNCLDWNGMQVFKFYNQPACMCVKHDFHLQAFIILQGTMFFFNVWVFFWKLR